MDDIEQKLAELDPENLYTTNNSNQNRSKKKKKKKSNPKKQFNAVQQTNKHTNNEVESDVDYVDEVIEDEEFNEIKSKFDNPLRFQNLLISTELINDGAVEQDEMRQEEAKLLNEDESLEITEDTPRISRKRLKKMTRMTLAQLKQSVRYPDLVEAHDCNSKEPTLLVFLKACKNTVPVPRHWCYKRRYLQGKRGFLKQPFELPDYIKATGIMEIRQTYADKVDNASLKAQMRHKIRPKVGKVDVDYERLHDAFFKYQTMPKITKFGDIYYEGKELESDMKDKRPGDLSDQLRLALGMPLGVNKNLVPPPWLIAMQRYGPPPSYPNLKIPGLNCPIPEGTSFGFHVGGWGKPPVDENGKPLYGDVFGAEHGPFSAMNLLKSQQQKYQVEKVRWGEFESENENDDEDSEEENVDEKEEEEEEEEEGQKANVKVDESGFETGDSLISDVYVKNSGGLATPAEIQLRKVDGEKETKQEQNQMLYKIISEKSKKAAGSGVVLEPEHTYELKVDLEKGEQAKKAEAGKEKKAAGKKYKNFKF